ncbi:hypothetical protein HZS_3280, partial [Henneguya salminicola]
HDPSADCKTNSRECPMEKIDSSCGNAIVEKGEDCDTGLIKDKCCTADCKFSSDSKCSPLNGQCCNQNCMLKQKGDICASETECRKESTCDGNSQDCRPGIKKMDQTECENGAALCTNGKCAASICLLNDGIECQCSSLTYLCTICCQTDLNSTCAPKKYISGDTYRKVIPGTACRNFEGFCSKDGNCLTILPEETLISLVENFLKEKDIIHLSEYIKNRRYYIIGSVFMYLLILSVIAFIFQKDKRKLAYEIVSKKLQTFGSQDIKSKEYYHNNR